MKNTVSLAIVNDEILFRKGMALLVHEFEGIELIIEADKGKTLLDKMAGGDPVPDIAILDLQTPTQDRLENTRLLAKRYPQTRIIILTLRFSKAFILYLLEIGAAAFLPREFTAAELETSIREVVQKGFCYDDHVLEIIREGLMKKKYPAFLPLDTQISDREKDVLQLICGQYTHTEIADKLFMSARTVEWHRKNLLQKLHCRNTAGLVALATLLDLVQIDPGRFWT